MKTSIATLTAICVAFMAASLPAKTVTEGTLDIRELVSSVTADLRDYQERKTKLLREIESTKKSMEKLSQSYERSRSEKDRYRFKAESLDMASQMVDAYTQVLELTEEKARTVIPSLEKIRKAVQEGPVGSKARDLENPKFRQGIRNFYGNMASLALTSNDPGLKRDVAGFLKETEMLYAPQSDNSKEFKSLLQSLDTITEKFYSAYAQAALRKKILRQKKDRLQIAIEMVRYSLALNTIRKGLDAINPEDFQNIPDVDFNIEGLIDSGSAQTTTQYGNPQTDDILKDYQNGPKSWR
ncbi:MAG: hypothetical protein Q7J31_04455 [Syntrophales bacterium]|nr:hypothetical protein [Syntrophales bacterium]